MSALGDVGFSAQRRDKFTRESISLPAFEYAILLAFFNERQLQVLELLSRGWSLKEIALFLGDRRIQGVWASIYAIRDRLHNAGQTLDQNGPDFSDLREYALKAKTEDTQLGQKLKEVGEQLGDVVRPVVGVKPESGVMLRKVELSAPIDHAQELAPQDSPTPPLLEAEKLTPEQKGTSAIHLEAGRVQRVRDLALNFRELFRKFPQPNFVIPSTDFGSWMNRYEAVLTKTREDLVGKAKGLEWRLSSPEGTELRERIENAPGPEFSLAEQEPWMKQYAIWHKEVKALLDKVLAVATSNRNH